MAPAKMSALLSPNLFKRPYEHKTMVWWFRYHQNDRKQISSKAIYNAASQDT